MLPIAEGLRRALDLLQQCLSTGGIMKFFALIFNLIVALAPAFAFANLETDFQAIKNNGRSLVDIGSICEEVAQLDMKRKYNEDDYTVLTSIAYSDLDGTVGELDIIVFEKATNTAILVGEVKCWKDMGAGLRKALSQRARFQRNVNSSKALTFSWLPNPSAYRLTKQQFNKVRTFTTIAQKGSRSAGYDMELEHSLEDLMELRSRIMQCQSKGECKRPDHH